MSAPFNRPTRPLANHPLAGHPLARHPLARHPLARKLAIVTAIKLLGLLALWWAFFSGQGDGAHQGGMTPEQAAAAILHPEIIHATQ